MREKYDVSNWHENKAHAIRFKRPIENPWFTPTFFFSFLFSPFVRRALPITKKCNNQESKNNNKKNSEWKQF